jgi:hypothetical protein
MQQQGPIDPALRLQPGQQALIAAQEGEAKRFAAERIRAQLSMEPVDEGEAEHFLRQVYAAVGLPPAIRIQWVDAPLQLVRLVATLSRHNGANRGWENIWARLERLRDAVRTGLEQSVGNNLRATVEREVEKVVEARVRNHVWAPVETSVLNSVEPDVWASMESRVLGSVVDSVGASVRAYDAASMLTFYRFFDAYFAPNALCALAHCTELVAGYWLGNEGAIVVRRPKELARDEKGRLHSATGKCIEYRDGWGFYAWHGVVVPEKVILHPHLLTREDFEGQGKDEVRRVMQVRMGERLMAELDGVVIDSSPQGLLYEVEVSTSDAEPTGHYVHLQHAPNTWSYFLRVPLTIQTVDEAMAWIFQGGVEDDQAAQEP